jgi:hypothetical protein
MGRSIADEVGEHPEFALPATVHKQLVPRITELGQFGR